MCNSHSLTTNNSLMSPVIPGIAPRGEKALASGDAFARWRSFRNDSAVAGTKEERSDG